MALGGALGLDVVARDAAAFCVAGAAQTHIYRRFAWQAWHKLTSTVVLRGRRGTNSHLPSFCVAGVAQIHIYRCLAWQVWYRWHWVTRLVLVESPVTPRHFAWQARHKLTSTVVLRGRCGTNSHLPSFCVGGPDGTGWRAWSWFSRP